MQTPTYPTNIKSLQDKTAMTCWMLTVCVTQTNAGRFAHVEQISGIDTQCLESVPWSHMANSGWLSHMWRNTTIRLWLCLVDVSLTDLNHGHIRDIRDRHTNCGSQGTHLSHRIQQKEQKNSDAIIEITPGRKTAAVGESKEEMQGEWRQSSLIAVCSLCVLL